MYSRGLWKHDKNKVLVMCFPIDADAIPLTEMYRGDGAASDEEITFNTKLIEQAPEMADLLADMYARAWRSTNPTTKAWVKGVAKSLAAAGRILVHTRKDMTAGQLTTPNSTHLVQNERQTICKRPIKDSEKKGLEFIEVPKLTEFFENYISCTGCRYYRLGVEFVH